MTLTYLVSLSLGWETYFNGSKLLFVQVIQQHIHDVSWLACPSRTYKQGLYIMLDKEFLQVAVSHSVYGSDYDILHLCVLREVVELFFVN